MTEDGQWDGRCPSFEYHQEHCVGQAASRPLEHIEDRTWCQLAAAVRVSVRALERLAGQSADAREAMDSMTRILSDDWDGREGAEAAGAEQGPIP